jgi:hypothetical protein
MATTSEHIGSAFKTFAKVGGALLVQILLFTAVGIVLNLVFTVFLWPEFKALVPSGGNPGARAGGAAVILVVIIYFLPPALLAAFFLILMPLTFFLVGKKQGVKSAISKLVHEKGNVVVGFIVTKFTNRLAEHPEWKTSVQEHGVVKTVRKVFPGFVKTLQGLPWLLKRPIRIVFEGIDFAGAIEEVYRTRPDEPINSPETNLHLTTQISTKLQQKFQPPKGKLLLFMVGLNLLVFILAKIFI